jgi:hypothetical protein
MIENKSREVIAQMSDTERKATKKHWIPNTGKGRKQTCECRKSGFCCGKRATWRITANGVLPGFSCSNPDHLENVEKQVQARWAKKHPPIR